MNIELSIQQQNFLKEFASKHYSGAPDNRYTGDAIHVVETTRTDFIPYFEGSEDFYDGDLNLMVCTDDDYSNWLPVEEAIHDYYSAWGGTCPIPIIEFDHLMFMDNVDGEEVLITNYDEYFGAYGVEIKAMSWEKKYREPVAYFLILDQAKAYMEYQRHNLISPRVYTHHMGYDNRGDLPVFRDLLLSMGSQLLEEEKECHTD